MQLKPFFHIQLKTFCLLILLFKKLDLKSKIETYFHINSHFLLTIFCATRLTLAYLYMNGP